MIIDGSHALFHLTYIYDKYGLFIKGVYEFNTDTGEAKMYVERTDGEIVDLSEMADHPSIKKVRKILKGATLVIDDSHAARHFKVPDRKTYI